MLRPFARLLPAAALAAALTGTPVPALAAPDPPPGLTVARAERPFLDLTLSDRVADDSLASAAWRARVLDPVVAEAAATLGSGDAIVRLVRPDGRPAGAHRPAPGGAVGSTANALSFTFDSPTAPWSTEEIAQMEHWIADLYPAAVAAYGPPAFDLTVNIRKITYPSLNTYSPTTNEIGLVCYPQCQPASALCHEMIHAFRDDAMIRSGVYEEGMTSAGTAAVMKALDEYWSSNERHGGNQGYYELLNRPPIADWGGGVSYNPRFSLRYDMSDYAWSKLVLTSASFLADFNRDYYQALAAAGEPSWGPDEEPQLLSIARALVPAIDGVDFDAWHARQQVLNLWPEQGGYALYQAQALEDAVAATTVAHLFQRSSGVELPLAGVPVRIRVLDADGALLADVSEPTSGSGVATIRAELPAERLPYTGRLQVIASATTPGGVLEDTTCRSHGRESGLFGVVANALDGVITATHLASGDTASTTLTRGCFDLPSMESRAGAIEVSFRAADGRRAACVVTKDISPYGVVLEARAAAVATVPDDFPTLQAAIASGADTIQVRAGAYPETPTLGRSVALLNLPDPSGALPTVDGLVVTHPGLDSQRNLIQGLRCSGPLHLAVPGDREAAVEIAACELEAGITAVAGAGVSLDVHDCRIFGSSTLSILSLGFRDNTVEAGGITAQVNGPADSHLTGNWISGPAPVGIHLINLDQEPSVAGNTVIGTDQGIVAEHPSFSPIRDNLVRGCAGAGIRLVGGDGSLENNSVLGCGGNGIELEGGVDLSCSRNLVDSVGLVGIIASQSAVEIFDNQVRHAGGTGIQVGGTVPSRIAGNVVGRCGGRGVAVYDGRGVLIRGNTLYLNQGTGIEVWEAIGDTVDGNIAHANGAHGLFLMECIASTRGCNDWFGNALGAVRDGSPAATDLEVDPQFCDLAADRVHLQADSPLLAVAGCGQIGARGVGCTGPPLAVPVAASPPGFSVWPRPAAGDVHFAWTGLAGATALSVYDLTGARRWSARLDAGVTTCTWSRLDGTGRPVAPGIYWAKLEAGGRTMRARILLIR